MGELCLQKKSRSKMPWKPPVTTLSNVEDDKEVRILETETMF